MLSNLSNTTKLLLLTFPLLFSSCLFGVETDVSSSGRYVSVETLARIQPGESTEFVVALLGDPNEKLTSASGNQIWRWDYSSTTTESGGVFLIARTKKRTSESNSTYVEFSDGVVVNSWRD